MTSNLDQWLCGVPMVLSGDLNFEVWICGAPFVDLAGPSGGGAVGSGGARIVSPRQPADRVMNFSFSTYRRRVFPGKPRSRVPL